MLSVAIISVAVVADVYSVESSACIETLALHKVSGMSFVKIEKSKGPKQLPWGIPDCNWIIFDRLSINEHPLCSVRQVTLYPHYSRGCTAITHMFFQQQTMINNVKSPKAFYYHSLYNLSLFNSVVSFYLV